LWSERTDDEQGRVQVTVEPSSVVPLGIYVAVNDHYDLAPAGDRRETQEDYIVRETAIIEPSSEKIGYALELLTSRWSDSMEQAEAIIHRIWNLRRAG
jgi:hypothetical protein